MNYTREKVVAAKGPKSVYSYGCLRSY